jgi:hypothetical protein
MPPEGCYTSMSVDPRDGCTFWYMNEYDSPAFYVPIGITAAHPNR